MDKFFCNYDAFLGGYGLWQKTKLQNTLWSSNVACWKIPDAQTLMEKIPKNRQMKNYQVGYTNSSKASVTWIYPLENIQKAIEHGHRNSDFYLLKIGGFSIVM
jgi:hypothetical protein